MPQVITLTATNAGALRLKAAIAYDFDQLPNETDAAYIKRYFVQHGIQKVKDYEARTAFASVQEDNTLIT